ncbi:hypothetical protein D3C71_79660 [compost metagenome]
MHSKNNRQNHDFQIVYFLVGDCHTPDGAYSLLCDLREDRENALGMVQSGVLKEKAKRLRAERVINNPQADEVDKLEAEAELSEIEAMAACSARNVAAAQAELATINKCIAILQPMRRFAHLPDHEANEACQREEWKLELISRAENSIMTTGTIATDQFKTMRMHPDFQTDILPALSHVKALVLSRDPAAVGELRKLQDRPRTFDLPKILAALPNYVQGLPAIEG